MAFKLARNQEQQEGGQRNSLKILGFQADLKMLKFHEDSIMLRERWSSLWTPSLGVRSPPRRSHSDNVQKMSYFLEKKSPKVFDEGF